MSRSSICPDCGNVISSSGLGQLCPFCLASSVADELENRTPVTPVGVSAASYEWIGPYRILDRLGEGGYGVVFRAEQERPLQRTVAIKILKDGAMSEQAVARFEAERQALAMMKHPSIAHVYDVGETDDGLPYFAMELIEGFPISTYCDEAQLALHERLLLFTRVCSAIGHAHRRGIIHRDLKPSNILVSGEGEEALPKVIDFGIAKATETLLTDRTLVTRDHQLVGTPAYMSPEQAAMQGGEVDIRADIYSLGVILYELLTGTTPFRVEELAELPYDESLRKIRTEDPPRPSTRCRDRRRPDAVGGAKREECFSFRSDLDWVVMKALEKDPARRYETADALARDLERYVKGEAIAARPPTPGYLLRKFVRRHRVSVLAAGAVLLAMVIGTIASLVLYSRAEKAAELAIEKEALAGEQAWLATMSEERRRHEFGRADLLAANRLVESGHPSLALAHLCRAVRTHPTYESAATRLLQLTASQDWPTRKGTTRIAKGGRLAFTLDGKKLLVARYEVPGSPPDGKFDPYLRAFDPNTGELLQEFSLSGDQMDYRLFPDGVRVAVACDSNRIEIWNLETGQKEREISNRPSTEQLRISNDGRWIGCSYWGSGEVQLWDVESGGLRHRLQLPKSEGPGYGSLAFSKDSREVAIAYGNVFQVFSVSDGVPVSKPLVHSGLLTGVALLKEQGRVLSWSLDGRLRVWDYGGGEEEMALAHERGVVCAAVSPDGSRVVTGSGGGRIDSAEGLEENGMVRLWDLSTGQLIGEPILHRGKVLQVAFSADGSKAVSASRIREIGDGAVEVIDALTGVRISASIYHPRGAESIALGPWGHQLAVTSEHHDTGIWSLRPSAMEPTQFEHPAPVWRAVFEEVEGRAQLLTLTEQGVARRWDVASGALRSKEKGETSGSLAVAAHARAGDDTLRHGFHFRRKILDSRTVTRCLARRYREGGVLSAAVTSDGQVLATGCADGLVRLWSIERGELLGRPLSHGGEKVTAVAFGESGALLASGDQAGNLKLWDVSTGRLREGRETVGSGITALTISPSGSLIAAGSMGGQAWLWRPGRSFSGAMQSPSQNGRARISQLSINEEETILAVSGEGNAVSLWSCSEGKQLCPPLRHLVHASSGMFLLWAQGNERLVSAGSADGAVRVWDLATYRPATSPMLQTRPAWAIAMRPGGEGLLEGTKESRVWDLRTGQPYTSRLQHAGMLYSAAFDPSGSRFALGTSDGRAHVYDFPDVATALPEPFVRFAEAVGGLRFTDEGVLMQLSASEVANRLQELSEVGLGEEGPLGDWMRWLASEWGEDRAVSPFSDITIGQRIKSLLKEGTVESLRVALFLRPDDAMITARLGYALVSHHEPSERKMRYGGFLARRAVELDPLNTKLKLILASVVAQQRLRAGGRR